MSYLPNQDFYFFDATFKVDPPQFEQLLIVQTILKSRKFTVFTF